MHKKVLYLSYDGMTDTLGQSQVLPYLSGLSKHNLKFTLISFEKEANFRKKQKIINEICATNNIEWHPLKYTKRPPVLSTIWDYLKMVRKAKRLHQSNNYDIIHCRSYISSLAGLEMKKKYGVKFLFDMRGFWADERVDGNLWNLKNPIYKLVYKFFKAKERAFIKHSDLIISLTNSGKKEMLYWNIPELKSEKIRVIPCAADFELFRLTSAEKRKTAKESLGLSPSDFVLSYIGSIGTWYLLDEMIRYFNLLKTKVPDAKFLILTPDDKDFIIRNFEKYNIPPSDIIIRFAERKNLPELAYASDINIFFIKPAYSKISSSPTKMGEVLAMGIPVICNSKIGDVEDIIKETNSGICVNDFKQETLLSSINKIPEVQRYAPCEIRERSKKIFDLETGIESYMETFNLITGEPHE